MSGLESNNETTAFTQAASAAGTGTPAAIAAAEPPAAVTPATPGVHSSTAAAAAAAAAPPTPLEQRQWQRIAQRAVRLAVTAFKDATTKFNDYSSQGTAAATQLSNSVLSEKYLPGLELPAVLKGVQGLQAAAASKLQRRQQQQLGQLQELVQAMEAAVLAMQSAVADVTRQLNPAASWQASAPVFHMLCLPESISLLQQVLEMFQQELQTKQQLVDCLQGLTGGADNGSLGVGSSSSSSGTAAAAGKGFGGGASVEQTRRQLTASVSTWMVRPYVKDDKTEQLLQLLSDEMVGF